MNEPSLVRLTVLQLILQTANDYGTFIFDIETIFARHVIAEFHVSFDRKSQIRNAVQSTFYVSNSLLNQISQFMTTITLAFL